MKTIYPAIFKKMIEDGEEYFHVEFPSFPCGYTDGVTLEEAFMMAKEVLSLCVYHRLENDGYRDFDYFDVKPKDGEFVLLVDADNNDDIMHRSERTEEENEKYFKFIYDKAKEKSFTSSDIEFILGLKNGYFKNLYKFKAIPDEGLAKRLGKLLDIDYKLLLK